MHDGGTIDIFAPYGAFSGASRNKNHLYGTVDDSSSSNNNNDNIINVGRVAKISGGNYDVEPQQLDNTEMNGGTNNSNDIADNVDGFLDEFLALVDSSGGGDSMEDLMDTDANDNTNGTGSGSGSGDIAEEGLDWLEDMDVSAFLPPPAAPDAALDSVANDPLPSSGHEIEPVPEPAMVEDGAPAAATPVVAAAAAAAAAVASQAEGSSPLVSGEVSRAADSSATAAAASPWSAGLSAAVASVAPALAEGGAGAGRNGYNGGDALANTGGGGGVDGSDVSRKEQLRRQKVARYLAKKKNRQWSKAKASSYQSRQRVANSRPRHKGRFLPLESDFVSVAELQKRQRTLMKQMQEKATAAAKATVEAGGAPSFGPIGGGGASSLAPATNTPGAAAAAVAASGDVSPLSPELGHQVAV